jgi:RNA polymerase sigma-70 factor, ECF subfamily
MFLTNNDTSQLDIPELSITSDQTIKGTVDTATLVLMVKSKSEKGFNILYDKYCDVFYGILMKFVQRTDVADDLLQDIFFKIWKHIDRFDPQKGTFFTWMLNIARNKAIDYLRGSCHRNQQLHVNNDLFSLHKEYIGSKDSNNSLVEFKDIQSKVHQLDPKYADVIDLIFFYGCTHEQTAQIMNLPLGTIKTRARKGLGILRVLYQQ